LNPIKENLASGKGVRAVAEPENGKTAAGEPRLWPFIILALFVVTAVVVTPKIIECLGYPKPAGPGDFGDQFGAVNALFSGLAFVGVIAALVYQKSELALQRQELEQTRSELRGQKEQLEAQNKTFRQQTFENTFFQLLRLHNEIVDSLAVHPSMGGVISGRDKIASLHAQLEQKVYGLGHDRKTWDVKQRLERLDGVYGRFYVEHQRELGHYLRNLLAMLEFVANSGVQNPRLYSNIVLAQLSTSEISLLFYTGLSELGSNKFKPLIERFSLLEGLDKEKVAPAHLELYEPQAYGRTPTGSR
jgi:Putative phage abortive infection protein